MITIVKNQETEVLLSLDPAQLNGDVVDFLFCSPSQKDISLVKNLTGLGSGFYSLVFTQVETDLFVDDTYSYYLRQDGMLLKHGRVRLRKAGVVTEGAFDYVLDFLIG